MSAGAADAVQITANGGSAVADTTPGSSVPDALRAGDIVTSDVANAAKDVHGGELGAMLLAAPLPRRHFERPGGRMVRAHWAD